MKRLFLLSWACITISASFGGNVKVTTPIDRVVAVKQSTAMKVNMPPEWITSKTLKANQQDPIVPKSDEFLQLGNIYYAEWAFGWYNFTGPCIDYQPLMKRIVITNVLTELDSIETSDNISSIIGEISKAGFIDFSASRSLVSQDRLLTYLTQGGILVPPFAWVWDDFRIYASGAYYDKTTGNFGGQAIVVNKFYDHADDVVVSKEENNPDDGVYLFESRYRATAANNNDGSIWVAMPNFLSDGDSLIYQGNLNMLKTTVDEDGSLSTEIMQVDFATEPFATIKMAWSVTGKYGVVGAVTRDPAAEGFLVEKGVEYPVYIFTSDYGKTWSSVQNAANMSGINGISEIRNILKGTLLEDLGKTKDELVYTLTWFDFDVAVDRWGNLYFGGTILLHDDDGTEYVYPGLSPHGTLYSKALNEAENAETNIRKLTEAVTFSEPVGFGEEGWRPCTNMYFTEYGTDKKLVGNRFQFVQNKVGTKLFAFWSDAANYDSITITRAPDQDMMGVGWDLETNKFALCEMTEDSVKYTVPFNISSETDAEGKVHFLCLSKTTIYLEHNDWRIPAMCTHVYEIDDMEVNPFYYLNGIVFEKQDFKFDKNNNHPIAGEAPFYEGLDIYGSVKEVESLVPLNVYPNPATDEIMVDVEGTVHIYDMKGTLMKSEEVVGGKVGIGDLPNGGMIIKADGRNSAKIIKK